MNIVKSITLTVASLTLLGTFGCTSSKDSYSLEGNPFAEASTLPMGAPDFTKIKPEHYRQAIKAGIELQRRELQAIVDSKEAPTFQNVILAYEKSGEVLHRATNAFYAVSSADGTDEITAIEEEITPLLTAWGDEVAFNDKFFQKIKAVYTNERSSLTGEDLKLLDDTYEKFKKNGANLSLEQKKELEKINGRIAILEQTFAKRLPEAVNGTIVWVETKEELAGLSDADIAQLQHDAETQGNKAPYAIILTNTTQQPLLTSLENRALRERLFKASIHRADETSTYNTYPLVVELAQLRAKKAEILGFPNYASYSLSDAMAKSPEAVQDFLSSLIKAYVPKAKAEMAEIEKYAQKSMGSDFVLQPYDVFYYIAKMKKERFNFSEEDVKPYFQVDSVLEKGVFYAANRVYGLTFEERLDIPTYHKDMRVFTVKDKDGSEIGLFYFDPFRRPTKRGGAWMSVFQKQSLFDGTKPLVYNVLNVAKAPEGEPSFCSWDMVNTMFHEFGHALHGLLSNCKYRTLSGTDVPRDFVEFPSQFNEFFATVPEVFDHYAKHYKTNEPMPTELKENMLRAITFMPTYALGENLAATSVDQLWHYQSSADAAKLTPDNAPTFEENALEKVGLNLPQIPPRYRTSYFNHVWGGGYSAGYYSYVWTEVLAANVSEYFEKHGPLNPEVGQDFRDKILSIGYTKDLGKAFSDFTGLEKPDAAALLPSRGIK